jgi:hypothetical protein
VVFGERGLLRGCRCSKPTRINANTLRDRQALNGGDDEDPRVGGNRAGRGVEAMAKGSRWARLGHRLPSVRSCIVPYLRKPPDQGWPAVGPSSRPAAGAPVRSAARPVPLPRSLGRRNAPVCTTTRRTAGASRPLSATRPFNRRGTGAPTPRREGRRAASGSTYWLSTTIPVPGWLAGSSARRPRSPAVRRGHPGRW